MDCSKKTLRRKLDLLLRTGQILMESSADTSRVKRNMERTAAYLGLPKENLHMNIDYYMLQVNVSDEFHSFSKMQRCDKHVINMLAIQEVSKLSWRAIQKDYSLDKYEEELEKIAHGKHYYTDWMIAIGAGLACGGFISTPSVQAALPEFLRPILFTHTPWHPLLACALYIVPGVPLINAVNDLLDNYINTGLIRSMNTMLIVVSMSFGIMLAIKCGCFDGFVKNLSTIPHHSFYVYAIAAAISAMGFATIYNIPYRLMPWIAVGGIICVCTRNFVFLEPSSGSVGLGLGIVVGSLCGSALISIINIKAVHFLHTPHQCITIPAVIPIVPGVLMYRALYGFMGMHGVVGEVTHAMTFTINGSLVLLCIALGVAIPNIFARKWIAPHRNAKLQRLIDERRERGKFVDLHQYNV